MPIGALSTNELAQIFRGKFVEASYTECLLTPKRGRCVEVRRGRNEGFVLKLNDSREIVIYAEPDIVEATAVECPVPTGGRLRVVAVR